MPRKARGLTAAKVRTAGPGRYGDGDGLVLFVKPNGQRFWTFRYSIGGKAHEMGLGPASGKGAISLKEARERAETPRRHRREGRDPLAVQAAEEAARKAAEQAAAARSKTFREVAELYIGAHEASWRNAKHRQQWQNTLATYVFPIMGDLPVGEVDTSEVMCVLEPIWTKRPETASRVRMRIEAVLDYGRSRGWRSGENPARWRGHIANLLPRRAKVRRVEHHPALAWQEVGSFMAELRGQEGCAALALQFAILTGGRTGEVVGARWPEIDMQQAVWTIPPERMKAAREHRVPLSEAALAILSRMAPFRNPDRGDWVFPGPQPGRPLSNMAMLMLLRRMNKAPEGQPPRWRDARTGEPVTAHGFRSTLRSWAEERTNYGREVAEAALAHAIKDKTEAAYQRGDLFEKRRRLMDDWATFCAGPAPAGEVIPLRRAS
jgi:integrase